MRRMRRKYKVFIVIGVLVNVVLCLGLYVNYKLDNLVAGLNVPGVLFRDVASPLPGDITSESPDGNPSTVKPGEGGTVSPGVHVAPGQAPAGTAGTKPANTDIANSVLDKVNQPVEKSDLVKAGLVILKRLSSEEISYLYRVGNSKHQTHDELVRTREILLTKLSPEDIEVLQALGKKYGKDLRILDPGVPIK